MEKKGTFLTNITKGSVRLPNADFFLIPWLMELGAVDVV